MPGFWIERLRGVPLEVATDDVESDFVVAGVEPGRGDGELAIEDFAGGIAAAVFGGGVVGGVVEAGVDAVVGGAGGVVDEDGEVVDEFLIGDGDGEGDVGIGGGGGGEGEVDVEEVEGAVDLVEGPVLAPVVDVVGGVGGVDGVVDAVGEFLGGVEGVEIVVVVVAVAEFGGGAVEGADLPDGFAVDVGGPGEIADAGGLVCGDGDVVEGAFAVVTGLDDGDAVGSRDDTGECEGAVAIGGDGVVVSGGAALIFLADGVGGVGGGAEGGKDDGGAIHVGAIHGAHGAGDGAAAGGVGVVGEVEGIVEGVEVVGAGGVLGGVFLGVGAELVDGSVGALVEIGEEGAEGFVHVAGIDEAGAAEVAGGGAGDHGGAVGDGGLGLGGAGVPGFVGAVAVDAPYAVVGGDEGFGGGAGVGGGGNADDVGVLICRCADRIWFQ